ncbi:MAG: ATP-binding cassette domain-containing protein [Acidimicrobiia bacterium]
MTVDDEVSTHPVAPSPPAVVIDRVSKRFNTVLALNELTIVVPAARITVLLGPNGAGKTTAVRMITGAMTPDVGAVRTFGLDPDADGEAVRSRCGVVAAKPALYDRLSGFDNLLYAAELYGLGRNVAKRIADAADRFGIAHALGQQVGGYSTGMKTRLALSRSVLHAPDLLLFDEPTSGLDPESSQAVLQLIRDMTADGTTVVMCTHHLVEAEGLADQVVMMEDGTALVAGAAADLARRYWPHPRVEFDAEDRSALERLRSAPGVVSFVRTAQGVLLELDDAARVPDLVALLAQADARITKVAPLSSTLEDLYFALRKERA